MELDERFREGVAALELLRAELLDAREDAKTDPASWAGWARSFNHRLHALRASMAVLLEPPPSADPRLFALYDAASCLRALYEEMNRALQGGHADIARRRVDFEAALHKARDAAGPPED